ncbi:hypothetical protein [Paenibacillus sp. EKM212P]|uniref:hypothetical protein n=1 Tax=Paenibacillus sp. EKM212P TaxID=1683680 RepID=UPI001EECB5B2|nr:hypothetical protein [Paenibacillus sp. EKM212P]
MSQRFAKKIYISTGQMHILMFHFILGNSVIINLDNEYERNTSLLSWEIHY